MPVAVTVNTSGSISSVVKEVLEVLSPSQRTRMNAVASREVVKSVKSYHRAYDAAGKWRKTGGGGSTFGEQITRGWFVDSVTEQKVIVANAGPHYRQKVEGGTITAKRASALTIPLVPEAKGRFVAVYEQIYGRKLFRPKGKDVLMEKLANGDIRAVYALKKSVRQRPWAGAFPPEKHYLAPFVASIEGQIERALRA
jgi:hypothetical protein